MNLKKLKEALIKAASKETAYNPSNYTKYKHISPLVEHCGAVAYVVKELLGGKIIMGIVDGERHFWNQLSDLNEIDLSSCQYGGDGFNPVCKGRIMPIRKNINSRFQFYKNRVLQYL